MSKPSLTIRCIQVLIQSVTERNLSSMQAVYVDAVVVLALMPEARL